MRQMSKSPFFMAALAAVAPPVSAARAGPVDHALAAFQAICATGPFTPDGALARADRQGWRSTGSELPKGFDAATMRIGPPASARLILTVSSNESSGERRDACGIGIESPTNGLASAVQQWLGFPPAMAIARSATFFAVRHNDEWLPGAIGKAGFTEAKAEGRFYSIMVLDRGSEEPDDPAPRASIVLLRVKPGAAP